MKIELEQCLRLRFPEIYPYGLMTLERDDECAVYRLLRHFGSYCSGHLEAQETAEIMTVMNELYHSKDLFCQNAIENEFLAVLAEHLGPADLMTHLNRIPGPLQITYIKVLLEILKYQKTA